MPSERKSRGLLILSLFFIALFCILGTWQISRGLQKNQIAAAYSHNKQQQVVAVNLPLDALTDWNHKEVSLQGHYDEARVFLLDNQVRDGQVGYNVISLFKVANGKHTVLVDRGWIAAPANRGQLPVVSTQTDDHTLQGNVYIQSKPAFALGGIDEGETQRWPRRIQFINIDQLAEISDAELQPFILRLSPNAPQGFRRDWQDNGFPASKHFGYAFQWFSLAITIFILMIIFNRTQKNDRK